jgi:hypothetical protein
MDFPIAILTTPSLIYPLPLAYPDTFQSFENYSLVNNSIKYVITMQSESIVEGEGSIILRNDTTFEVLRIRKTEFQTDSVFHLIEDEWTFIRDTTFENVSLEFLAPKLANYAVKAEKVFHNDGTENWYMTYYEHKYISNINKTLDAQIKIYPNPFFDALHLEIPSYKGKVEIIIQDCFQKTVFSIDTMHTEKVIIPRGNLSAGFYFVKILMDGRLYSTNKVVIID